MLSISDLGNIFAKTKYNLPTIDVSHCYLEFTSPFQLLDFLEQTGEQSALLARRESIPEETLIAAAALYQTLFNNNTIVKDQSTVLIDSFRNVPFSENQ